MDELLMKILLVLVLPLLTAPPSVIPAGTTESAQLYVLPY